MGPRPNEPAPDPADPGTVQRPAGESPHVVGADSLFGGVGGSFHSLSANKPTGSYPFLSPSDRPDELGRLGRYRIVKLLGEGGMGFVFRAEDDGLQREVALKVMRPEVALDPNARERFLREGRAAAAIKSDHVITIHDVGEAGGVVYLAMEYLAGLNLEDWLRAWQKTRQAPVPPRVVVRLAEDILKGLMAAHDKGLIHRDIKPANLWVEKDTNRVKLLDFGLTRGGRSDAGLTQTGQVLGTPTYMAPEQARGQKVDARADLFSVGVVLYRILTGQSPFVRPDPMAAMFAVAFDPVPSVASLKTEMPDDLGILIDRLLAKNPEERPASAKAALAVIAEVKRQLRPTSTAVPVVPLPPVRPPEPPPPTRDAIAEAVEVELAVVVDPTPPPPVARRPIRAEPVARPPAPTPWSGSSARVLPEEDEPDEDEPGPQPRRKPKSRALVYGLLGGSFVVTVAVLLIGMMALKDRRPSEPTSKGSLTALGKGIGEGVSSDASSAGTKSSIPAPPPAPKEKESNQAAVNPKGPNLPAPAPVGPKLPEPKLPEGILEDFKYEIESIKGFKTSTRRVLKVNLGSGESMEFVWIEPGTFMMGAPGGEKEASPDETPHQVTISKGFYMGMHEVTQGQYKAVTGAEPSSFKGSSRLPVEQVSWADAEAFCTKMSARVNRKIDLPTEAEWEYACRAGTTTPFHFGSTLNGDRANCDGNFPYGTTNKGKYLEKTVEVGSYSPNKWGLYDMHGNVWEWCKDYYGSYSSISTTIDPFQSLKQSEDRRVLRGGAWSDDAWDCRAALRRRFAPDYRDRRCGFRACLRLD